MKKILILFLLLTLIIFTYIKTQTNYVSLSENTINKLEELGYVEQEDNLYTLEGNETLFTVNLTEGTFILNSLYEDKTNSFSAHLSIDDISDDNRIGSVTIKLNNNKYDDNNFLKANLEASTYNQYIYLNTLDLLNLNDIYDINSNILNEEDLNLNIELTKSMLEKGAVFINGVANDSLYYLEKDSNLEFIYSPKIKNYAKDVLSIRDATGNTISISKDIDEDTLQISNDIIDNEDLSLINTLDNSKYFMNYLNINGLNSVSELTKKDNNL